MLLITGFLIVGYVGYGEDEPPEGMVLISAGDFQMGSADSEADYDERPVYTVHADTFYMDKYEVTNLEYQKFVLANPRWQKERIDEKFHKGER